MSAVNKTKAKSATSVGKEIIYERSSEQIKQNKIGQKVAAATKLYLRESRHQNRVDFELFEGKYLKAALEIRMNGGAITPYGSYPMPYDKWLFMRSEWKTNKIPHVLVVEFNDGIYTVQVADQDYKIVVDENDILTNKKQTIYVPHRDMRKLNW